MKSTIQFFFSISFVMFFTCTLTDSCAAIRIDLELDNLLTKVSHIVLYIVEAAFYLFYPYNILIHICYTCIGIGIYIKNIFNKYNFYI